MEDRNLYHYVDPADPDRILEEIEQMMAACQPTLDMGRIRQAFRDVENLFQGRYPGYRASNTRYHDLEHTCAVFLACSRLIYGAMAEGMQFSVSDVLKGLLAALFHDVGLIQQEGDTEGTGAKYAVGHEKRSIRFMRSNLEEDLPEEDLEDIADCIQGTSLKASPSTIAFPNENIRHMGSIVASADLLAQMADPRYPGKLFSLFEEFKEAGLPEYDSALDLLMTTRNFYEDVARKRLDNDLDKACRYMRAYFRSRWQEDRDLYEEGILRNLEYLDSALDKCKDDLDCLREHLQGDG